MPLFAHLTDLHLRPPGVLTQGFVDTYPYAEAAILAVIARHADIDAVLVTGDVADQGEPAAYTRAAALLGRFRVPVFAIPGNHDLVAPMAGALKALPGFDQPSVPGRLAHAHRVGQATVVCLDTSLNTLDPARFHGALGAAQLAWLDEVLAGAGPVLIAMHHPPFATGIREMDQIGLRDAAELGEIVRRHGNVVRIVCGHIHRTVSARFAGTDAMVIPGTAHQVSLALASGGRFGAVLEPPAYALHSVTGDTVVSHVVYVEDAGPPRQFGDHDEPE